MSFRPERDFEPAVCDAFGFLVRDFGCSELPRDPKGGQDLGVAYANETTFVLVSFDDRDDQIGVQIGPLSDAPLQRAGFDLGFLLLVRGIPQPTHRGSPAGRLSRLQSELAELAVALRLAASDVLGGDFRVLDLVRAIIEERRPFSHDPIVTGGTLLPRPK